VFTLFCCINAFNKNTLINVKLEAATNTLENNFDITTYINHRDAVSIDMFLKSNKRLFEIVSEALDADEEQRNILRAELYALLTPQYTSMREKGIFQFQFVFPNNKSFLRMQKPNKHGDDIGNIRYSIKTTNTTHTPTSGFEEGIAAYAFTNVFPLFDENKKYLGCYEIALTSKSIQDNLTKIHKIHSHFLVKKDIFDAKILEIKDQIFQYIISIEHQDYLLEIVDYIDDESISYFEEYIIAPNKEYIKKNMDSSKKFALYQRIEDKVHVVAFLPIKNLQNKTVSYLVSYTQNPQILDVLRNFFIINILSFFVLFLLFFLTYKMKILEIQLQELNAHLQEEVQKQTQENLLKDKMLQEQSKLAAMGEMVGAIAHQWRQPLNSLNINIQNLDDDYDDGLINKEFIDTFIKKQTQTIQFMSKTIDDFRNFFRVDKIKKVFSVKKAIQTAVDIQSAQLKHNNISFNLFGDDFYVEALEGEFQQTILNIISNAKDAILDNKIAYGRIDIKLDANKIYISDNGGGIAENLLERVFEPYFTTKEQGHGTGIGLYMSKMIIEQNLGGTLSVSNQKEGAEFVISFKKVL
jgi:signal transduction histidine kinase